MSLEDNYNALEANGRFRLSHSIFPERAQIPDGVLISGDVTNGKTAYLERALQVGK
jgi:hypothetical protein